MKKIFNIIKRELYWDRVLIIISIIIFIFLIIILCQKTYNKFYIWNCNRLRTIESKKTEESIQQSLIDESINESIKLVESERLEKDIQIQKNKADAENEQKITSQLFYKNRYYRNNKTKQYGIIESFQGLRVLMKEGWYYDINPENIYENDIVEVGYPEYRKNMLKQLDNKKMDSMELYKLSKIWEDEQLRLSNYVSKLFPLHYSYVLTNDGVYDQVKGYDGLILILKHSKRRIMYTECSKISFHEYEKSKINKKEK